MNSDEIKQQFRYRDLLLELSTLKNQNTSLYNENKRLKKFNEDKIEKEVEIRTRELTNALNDKNKEIEALKVQIAKMQSTIDNDASNSGISTSKTPIGKKKYIPNSRVKTDKPIGGQKGHAKHKLQPFSKEEITEEVEVLPVECPKCHSKELEKLDTSVDKKELDYDVKIIKRNNKFTNCKCKNCGHLFHANIPNDLKEDIQYGKTLQSLAVCLTNEIYTPFNKTSKLVYGITNGEINLSESYITKLQKKASNLLGTFISDTKKYISKSPVFGWDDGVICINTKNAILRTYCTDNVALFIGHENKNEDGLDEDGILLSTSKDTIVMHDHLLHNYNDKYKFDNVECVAHLNRRLKKVVNNTKHDWGTKLNELLSKTVHDRNIILKDKNAEDKFDEKYLKELNFKYDEIISLAEEQNKDDVLKNPFKEEEETFIKDLIKYKRNYLLWAYNFELPATNNNSEKNIRPIKSKMKISGQFKNIDYAKYYANIRSYIETCKKNNINIVEACEKLMNGNPYTLEEILQHSSITAE